jgi:hypothetical protein
MPGDSQRFCLSCNRYTMWHLDLKIHHSVCRVCGHPSLWSTNGKNVEKKRKFIEEMIT